MTGFENKTFKTLVNIKASELILTETKEGKALAEELQNLVDKIYSFQQKIGINEHGLDC